MKHILLLLLLTISAFVEAQGKSCVGIFESFDDKTNEKQSRVEFYKKNDRLYAKVLHLYTAKQLYGSDDPTCINCKDDRKDKKIVGIEFIRNLSWNGKEWENGTICNTMDGKIYKLKIWLDKDNQDIMNVRVFLGPFFRTQLWKRVK